MQIGTSSTVWAEKLVAAWAPVVVGAPTSSVCASLTAPVVESSCRRGVGEVSMFSVGDKY